MRFSPTKTEVETAFTDLQGAYSYLGGGVSVRTLRRWIATGRLPAYRPGGKILVRRADLDALVERARIPAPDLDELVDRLIGQVVGRVN